VKRIRSNQSEERSGGPWVHLRAVLLLCLAAAAIAALCVLATPANAESAEKNGACFAVLQSGAAPDVGTMILLR